MLDSTRFLVPLLLAEVVGTAVMVAALALPSWAQPTTAEAEGAAAHKSRFAGGEWQNGETLFGKNCASCHGSNLEGRCMAPSLRGVTRRMTDDAIVAHARRIGETMCCARHIGKISDAEFADIVAYFSAVDRDPEVGRRAAGASGKGGCCCRPE
jgi:mono/diheme cytochrome c family protein